MQPQKSDTISSAASNTGAIKRNIAYSANTAGRRVSANSRALPTLLERSLRRHCHLPRARGPRLKVPSEAQVIEQQTFLDASEECASGAMEVFRSGHVLLKVARDVVVKPPCGSARLKPPWREHCALSRKDTLVRCQRDVEDEKVLLPQRAAICRPKCVPTGFAISCLKLIKTKKLASCVMLVVRNGQKQSLTRLLLAPALK